MEMSGQIHDPAALSPGEEPPECDKYLYSFSFSKQTLNLKINILSSSMLSFI
jgi:hypothetical protein